MTTTLNSYNLMINYKILIEAAKKLHWLKIGEDGIPELYLDNHMMQTFRACESRGYEEFYVGRKGKNAHYWFLDFGIALHKMIEYYYKHRKESSFDVIAWATQLSRKVWDDLKIDEYYSKGQPWEHKNHAALGGWLGFCALLMEYAQFFHVDNERFRVIGTELYFGKAKEVYLGTINFPCPFRLYLSGKIDLLIDDGHNIGPFDHKSSSNFGDKNPIISYEVHEGMTGYVYATKALLKNWAQFVTPSWQEVNINRQCNKIWMNFIQVQPLGNDKSGKAKDPRDRFKRIPLLVTDYQLEAYAKRQLTTASRMLSLLLYPDLQPDRNTMMCTNYMHHNCAYRDAHRQNTTDDLFRILNTDFEIGPIWNPEDRDNDNIILE